MLTSILSDNWNLSRQGRFGPAGNLLKEVLSGDVLKVIHKQVYVLLSCNRRRANRAAGSRAGLPRPSAANGSIEM